MPHRNLFKTDSWEYGHDTRADEQPLAAPKKRRLATTLVYTALFVAGAAFVAFAGDQVSQITGTDSSASSDAASSTDATTTDASQAAPDGAQASADAAQAPADAAQAPADATAPSDNAAPADATAPAAQASASGGSAAPDATSSASGSSDSSANGSQVVALSHGGSWAAVRSKSAAAKFISSGRARDARAARAVNSRAWRAATRAILFPKTRPAPPPEIEGSASGATIWLNNPLPDPTPPAVRLSERFARNLESAAHGAGIDWALELAILRAKGLTGHTPADKGTLIALAHRLAAISKKATGEWEIALAYDGQPAFADKVQALARYNRAVGLAALVNGLESAKRSLGQRLLDDPQIDIYPGGRSDIANNKVDVRVLAVISYLHQAFGEVTVSCLISGHRLYARPGVISAHIYGRAVDIAALGGVSILGHQQPGGITEDAVKDILLLPSEDMPQQVISLLGLGGPSFPLADHYNHIHIGY